MSADSHGYAKHHVYLYLHPAMNELQEAMLASAMHISPAECEKIVAAPIPERQLESWELARNRARKH